jgi:hypothetical protein
VVQGSSPSTEKKKKKERKFFGAHPIESQLLGLRGLNFFFFLFLCVLGIESRVLHMISTHTPAELQP